MNHMRTLKKVLALSLVFAMAFTMMAGAAFKDQNKIDSSLNNDIQLLTALGVFKGDENGNFNPTANVKRSEAAKMIYVLKNNGVDDGAVAFQGVSKYADVPVGHWAEGYINYCTNLGYMGGWKEGNVQKFDPNGNVTGVELTKMLLCMIGYKADIQGYTGNGWQTNVLVDAATSGLSANFIPSVYGATPRQWTARLMTNALDAEWVTYSKGELTYKGNTYAEQFLGLRTAEGILAETNSNKLGSSMSASLNDSDKVRVTLYVADASGNYPTITAVGDADDSLLGQPVKMYYKHAGTTSEAKLYAVLPYAKNHKVVNTTIDAIKYDSNADTTVTIEGLGKMDYTKSTVTGKKINLYMNNVLMDTNTIDQLKSTISGNDSRAVTVVANKDGYAETILVHDMTAFAKVKKIDASKNTLTLEKASTASFLDGSALKDVSGTANLTFNNSSANKDNFNKYLNVASDVKDGSIVKITANTSTGKLVYDITLADKVEGTPTGYTLEKNGKAYASLTVNGKTLKLAANNNAMAAYTWSNSGTSIANDKVFYTDGKYVIFSEGGEATASVSNLAYLIKAGATGGDWNSKNMVKVVLADGTVAEYEYKDDTAGGYSDFATVKAATEKVYLYAMDGTKIKLKALPTDDPDANNVSWKSVANTDVMSFNKSNGRVTVKDSTGATVKADLTTDATSFFFVRTGTTGNYKYSVVKASEMAGNMETKGTDGNITYATKTINGFPTLLYGVIKSENAAVSDQVYAFGNGDVGYSSMEGDKYIVSMTANVNGKDETLKWAVSQSEIDSTIKTLSGFTGKVFTYTMGSDGYVSGNPVAITLDSTNAVAASAWNKVALTAWKGNSAYITKSIASSNPELVNVASDVKIHYVDSNSGYNASGATIDPATEQKAVTDGTVVVANDKLTQTATNGNAVVYIKNVDGHLTITEIFVEIDGMDIGTLA